MKKSIIHLFFCNFNLSDWSDRWTFYFSIPFFKRKAQSCHTVLQKHPHMLSKLVILTWMVNRTICGRFEMLVWLDWQKLIFSEVWVYCVNCHFKRTAYILYLHYSIVSSLYIVISHYFIYALLYLLNYYYIFFYFLLNYSN